MPAPIVTAAADPEQRRTGIGGTDAAAILGVSKFAGPYDVFLEKRGLKAPLIETERMRWGKLLEEPVAREYAIQSGRKVKRQAAFLRHPKVDYHFANIDRWSDLAGTPRRVLEVKTADVYNAADYGEPGTDEVPEGYLAQVMWYLYVTGKEVGDLAVLVGGNRYGGYTIPRDEDVIRVMVEKVDKFWSDTQQGIPPAMDGSDAAGEYLRARYADTGSERDWDDDLERLALAYEASRLEIKALTADRDVVGNRLRELMGNHRFAVGNGVKILYSETAGRTLVDWKAVAAELADIVIPDSLIKKYTTQGEPGRQLRVTVTAP